MNSYVKKKRATVAAMLILLVVSNALSFLQTSLGAVVLYKVGDSAGWTTIGPVDYKQWTATKNFQVGDILLFVYNPQFHNVQHVTHIGYRSCNASSPIATYTTGNDSITLTAHDGHHHFFICGVPGHCQAGQKVDINVVPVALIPSVTLSPSSPGPSAPASSSYHSSLYVSNGFFVKLGLVVTLLALKI